VPKAIFVVKTSPAEAAREAEYNDWYANIHIPQICAVPGFVAARRYKLSPTPAQDAPAYLTIYEIDADDPGAALAEMRRRVVEGRIDSSDAVAKVPVPETALYHLVDG